jgi:hypothetical protein
MISHYVILYLIERYDMSTSRNPRLYIDGQIISWPVSVVRHIHVWALSVIYIKPQNMHAHV